MKIAILFTMILAATPRAEAGEKDKAALCMACHGEKGISPNPLWPNLAGQKKDYLVKQMLGFKNGDRKDPMMSPILATLSEQDILDLAAYFAGLNASGR